MQPWTRRFITDYIIDHNTKNIGRGFILYEFDLFADDDLEVHIEALQYIKNNKKIVCKLCLRAYKNIYGFNEYPYGDEYDVGRSLPVEERNTNTYITLLLIDYMIDIFKEDGVNQIYIDAGDRRRHRVYLKMIKRKGFEPKIINDPYDYIPTIHVFL